MTATPQGFLTPQVVKVTSERQKAQQRFRQRMGERAWLKYGLQQAMRDAHLLPGEATKLNEAYLVVHRLYLATQADMKNLKTLIPDHRNIKS